MKSYSKNLSNLGDKIVLIIGERINSSIKKIEDAITTKSSSIIQEEAQQQQQAGANVIDLNAGSLIKTEQDDIVWLIRKVGEVIEPNIGLAIDSTNPEVIAAGLEEIAKISKISDAQGPFVNSVTAEQDKLDEVLPLVKKFNAKIVGLCMDDHGIPGVPEKIAELGSKILNAASEHQIPAKDVYLDPLVMPVSTDTNKGVIVLKTLQLIKEQEPEVNTIVGLSNISYGLPNRPLLNQTFMVMLLYHGVDAVILNPLDKQLMSMIKASEVILGKDEYCMNYIKAYRNGEL